LGALAIGPQAFTTFAAIAFGAAAFEWLRLAAWPDAAAIVGGVVSAAVLIALQWSGSGLDARAVATVAGPTCVALLFVAGWLVRAERTNRLALKNVAVAVLAPLLLGGAWFAMLALYARGALFLFSALAVVWVADIAAYFAGRAWGKRKLAPHISPGKTWAGAVGAIVAGWGVRVGVWCGWPAGWGLCNI